jgi:tyrosyl-tRNA synthetase
VGPIFAGEESDAMNFLEELRWRGLLHDATPGLEEALAEGPMTAYVGFDPTADSLHIGNLVPVMLLLHWQRAGGRPIALVGGATGRVGDPSGKTVERQLLDVEAIEHNLACQQAQLERFLDFTGPQAARVVNNYDWFRNMGFLDFIRDVGKHITVNYMLAKDSVKNRLEHGMSFTEFSYQLIQGYDFYHLWKHEGVGVQMGGSDQWGNITTGTELIRRLGGGQAFAVTAPLVTKSDGTKFGKSEGGNVWIDRNKTSAYAFHQYWLNVADADAARFLRLFTLMSREEIEALEALQAAEPGGRAMQKALAADMTLRVHGEAALTTALAAAQILFGASTRATLEALTVSELEEVFTGVPAFHVGRSDLAAGIPILDYLCTTGFLPSRSEARRALAEGSIQVNKTPIRSEDHVVTASDLVADRLTVVQRGKKSFALVYAT